MFSCCVFHKIKKTNKPNSLQLKIWFFNLKHKNHSLFFFNFTHFEAFFTIKFNQFLCCEKRFSKIIDFDVLKTIKNEWFKNLQGTTFLFIRVCFNFGFTFSKLFFIYILFSLHSSKFKTKYFYYFYSWRSKFF